MPRAKLYPEIKEDDCQRNFNYMFKKDANGKCKVRNDIDHIERLFRIRSSQESHGIAQLIRPIETINITFTVTPNGVQL